MGSSYCRPDACVVGIQDTKSPLSGRESGASCVCMMITIYNYTPDSTPRAKRRADDEIGPHTVRIRCTKKVGKKIKKYFLIDEIQGTGSNFKISQIYVLSG